VRILGIRLTGVYGINCRSLHHWSRYFQCPCCMETLRLTNHLARATSSYTFLAGRAMPASTRYVML